MHNASSLLIAIRNFSLAITAALVIVWRVYLFLQEYKTRHEIDHSRKLHMEAWRKFQSSKSKEKTRIAIKYFTETIENISIFLAFTSEEYFWNRTRVLMLVVVVSGILSTIALLIEYNQIFSPAQILIALSILIFVSIMYKLNLTIQHAVVSPNPISIKAIAYTYLVSVPILFAALCASATFAFLALLAPLLWLDLVIKQQLPIAIILLVPTIWFLSVLYTPINEYLSALFSARYFCAFVQWMWISFVVTLLALYVGNRVSPQSDIPQTLQMLLVNSACDTVTVLTTLHIFSILSKLLKTSETNLLIRTLYIQFYILIDVLIAVILSVASLYFGVLGDKYEVSIFEAIILLIGKDSQGAWDFGPKFWAMHTTFIPSLFCWIVLIAMHSAELMLIMRAEWARRMMEVDKPYALTASVIAIHIAFWGLIAVIAEIGSKIMSPIPKLP
ncbi:MAG: hypothetical protein R3F46_02850 [bacterium]